MTADAVRSTIEAIWRAVLCVDSVLDDDDFYAAGGDSMGVISLVARVCEELDLEFDYKPFLAQPTFATLVRAATVSDPVRDAERAAADLLAFRPFHGVPAKPSVALAMALSEPVENVPPEFRAPLTLLQLLKETA